MLLLDEPVSAVDPQLRESFPFGTQKLPPAKYTKSPSIYVTHNLLSEAFVMSDRIAVMGNGHIEQVGRGDEISDKPASSYVAKFLGSNTFNGKAQKISGEFLEVNANGAKLFAPPVAGLEGKDVTIALKTEDVLVSKSGDVELKNCLDGCIVEMVENAFNRSSYGGCWVCFEGAVAFKQHQSDGVKHLR